ncbi:MAG: FadR family transcriptional regulator, partial [Deltaproteobacteria bacterium]|nr:FadR family transcriptional regulator [Deltaproteobacteria bacterium]
MEKPGNNLRQRTFGALEKKRYSQQIAQLIYERVLDTEFKKGERLPTERELAEDFQVSRTVIREAIRELELSGIVSVKKGPKGGIFIDHAYHKPLLISLQRLISSGMITVKHILETRLLIEPYITV